EQAVDVVKRINSLEERLSNYSHMGISTAGVIFFSSSVVIMEGIQGNVFRPNDTEKIIKNSEVVHTEGEPFLLSPNQFVLAQTSEKITISKNLAATLEGKSSVARLGIVVHAAGLVNPGTGLKSPTTLTLEISQQANSPVELVPGMPIIQIIFHQLSSEATIGYDEREKSKYVGLDEPKL
ncbi:unnamed protein product, partial [marine sediment metagenome]